MTQLGQVAPAAERSDGGDTPAGDADMSLVLRAGSLLCALRLDEIIETMRPLPVQPLAGSPSFVRGISIVRGVAVPVIDLARLLSGDDAPAARYVTVRTGRGPVAVATGPVLGLRPTVTATTEYHGRLLGTVPAQLVAAIGTADEIEPLIQLQSVGMVPDDVWAAADAEATP